MERPNLIFIMPDQLRYDFLSCYGACFLETPNIDRLAEKGVRYARAYSASPLCVPARASLLTGLNAVKNGVMSNAEWLRPDLSACGIRTWPETLSEAGYYTAAIGKMHFSPWDATHGFQYRSIAEDKRWPFIRDDYFRYLQEHGLRKLHGNEHLGYHENRGAIINNLPWEHSVDHFVGQEACQFIRLYGEEGPFAMMVGFPGPHCPYDPSEEFLEGIDENAMPPAIPEARGDTPKIRENCITGNRQPWNGVDYSVFTDAHKRKIRAHYAALVKQIDYEVGQILVALTEKGIRESTIVILSSDHGDYLGDHNLIGKGSFYEASTHVPMIVHVPWMTETRECDELVELTDVTATLLHFAGQRAPGYMDSKPLPDLGIEMSAPRDCVVGMNSSGWMLFDGTWKLSKYGTGEVTLFDLKDDPKELVNRVREPKCLDRYMDMDTRLSQSIMQSMAIANEDKTVDPRNSLWSSRRYGMQGRMRIYPNPDSHQ